MLSLVIQRIANQQPVRVVLYGDSISVVDSSARNFGGASSRKMNWGQQLKRKLDAEFPHVKFIVKHFSIGGQNSYEGLGRLDGLGKFRPDLVLIEFGTNDCAWHPLPPEATEMAIGGLIDGARNRYQADVVVLGPAGDNPFEPWLAHLEETRQAICKTAAKKHAPFIDMREAILRATEDGKRWKEFHQNKRDCHPTNNGHTVWANAVMDFLRLDLRSNTDAYKNNFPA